MARDCEQHILCRCYLRADSYIKRDEWSMFLDVDAYLHVTFHPDDSVAMVLVTWSAEALLCQAVASQNDLRDLQRQLSEHYSSECSYNAVHLCNARTLHGSCALQ